MQKFVERIPILRAIVRRVREWTRPFPGSERYWEERYASGDHSGSGSYGKYAQFKAEVINDFIAQHAVESVIEFGCGDGNQLKLGKYPRYLGLDISPTAISLCREQFAADQSKTFKLMSEYSGEQADLTLSLDVIFHLVEDAVFESYMQTLFGASARYVIIYSSNSQGSFNARAHERHRKFTDWVDKNAQGWKLAYHIPNRYPYSGSGGSVADFFIYEKARLGNGENGGGL